RPPIYTPSDDGRQGQLFIRDRVNATLDLELVQVEPQRYSQRLVKATTVRGRIAEGRFTGLDSEGRLVIRREMPGAGEASYLLRPAEIARLELLER
ncbi:hypothetical protein NYQ60_24735, partial [Pseudomonas aeruginosa]|nr:hypothetical protein [Pseudomonas aeruginosa]